MPGHSENGIRVHLCWRHGILRIRHVRQATEILVLMSQREMEKNREKKFATITLLVYSSIYYKYNCSVYVLINK